MIELKKDVVIVGAGISGIHSAIAAGRAGLDTLLLEREGFPGGASTLGLCNPFMRYWLDGKNLVGGIFEELLRDLASRGALLENSFDSEILKILYIEKLKTAGVTLALHSIPTEVLTRGESIETVKFYSSQGIPFEVRAKYFIDASGDAALAYLAGAEIFEGDDKNTNQAMTLMFTVAGIDYVKVREDVRRNRNNFFGWVSPDDSVSSVAGYFQEIKQARKDGYDKLQDYFFFIELPGEGRATVNTTHAFDKKASDPFELSQAVVECTEQIDQLIDFARKYVKGFENSHLEKIASIMGVRESRRVKGLYVFSGEDVKSHRKFEDGVVRATYGIDVHTRQNQSMNGRPKGGELIYEDYYEIPLRSLLSADFENLAIAGRCFSSDFAGNGAARIMPTVAGMGQAVGSALYLAKKNESNLSAVKSSDVASFLKEIAR